MRTQEPILERRKERGKGRKEGKDEEGKGRKERKGRKGRANAKANPR